MDLQFTTEQEAFRAEVRAWIAAHVPTETPPADGRPRIEFERAWQAALAGARLVAVHFPAAYGGRDLGWTEAFIVQEELALARAPEIVNRVAINLVGPTLLEHGTEEQRRRHLQRAITADDIWCQLFSEPEAGSDLGSMRTRAVAVDGGWRVTGQKVWVSNAQYARYGVLLARTADGNGRRAKIGYFLLDMEQPGIDVRPLRQMTGESEFNEVFLDNAFVPDDVGRGRSVQRVGGHEHDARFRTQHVAPAAHRPRHPARRAAHRSAAKRAVDPVHTAGISPAPTRSCRSTGCTCTG